MDVGFDMFILVAKCATMRGSRPRPVKVEESKGALLGREICFGIDGAVGSSTFGLEVNREEMTWGRDVGATVRGSSSTFPSRPSFTCDVRGFLDDF